MEGYCFRILNNIEHWSMQLDGEKLCIDLKFMEIYIFFQLDIFFSRKIVQWMVMWWFNPSALQHIRCIFDTCNNESEQFATTVSSDKKDPMETSITLGKFFFFG